MVNEISRIIENVNELTKKYPEIAEKDRELLESLRKNLNSLIFYDRVFMCAFADLEDLGAELVSEILEKYNIGIVRNDGYEQIYAEMQEHIKNVRDKKSASEVSAVQK